MREVECVAAATGEPFSALGLRFSSRSIAHYGSTLISAIHIVISGSSHITFPCPFFRIEFDSRQQRLKIKYRIQCESRY